MDRWRGRVALVTGASVGIGAAVAKTLVQQGMKVVGCARNVEKIEKLAAECQSAGHSGTLVPFKCDLSSEEEILSMFSAIKTQHQGVDVCINNAGLAHPEPLLNGKTNGWRTMIDCISPGMVETEFVPRMYSQNQEKAAQAYTTMKCLQAEDIASAVAYVLSAPPHVQIGDVQMRSVEQVS